MKLRSIRWRLPLSYAAVALLAALSLGAVLLTILLSYYARQEAGYLRGNAKEINAVVAQALQSDLPPEALQKQIEVYALLSQSQVQVWDAKGQLLARADTPGQKAQVVSVVRKAVNANGTTVTARPERVAAAPEAPGAPPSGTPDEALMKLREAASPQPILFFALFSNVASTVPAAPSQSAGAVSSAAAGTAPTLPPDFVSSIPVVRTRLGIGFDPTAAWDGRRSNLVVLQSIKDGSGQPLGTLQLSNGPAYGLDIVESVARGWTIASAVAVVLAALAGWLMSRSVSGPVLALSAVTARMAGGDLSARADAGRHDELGQLAGSFNGMAERVEGTISALRRFVGDAAHELHTPLTALNTDLELAATEPDPATRADLIGRARDQVARLEALTTSLLDLSRLEAGAGQSEQAPVDLVDLVHQVSEPYASRAEQAGLDFCLDLPATPVTVRGEAAQLAGALGNLLDNACKFTPAGGEIAVALRCSDSWAEVTVQDTGIGIPADDLGQLFGRFHRARNAADYPGNGLGLAIVKAIAEAHGGEVRAEDTGHGARFALRLPRREG